MLTSFRFWMVVLALIAIGGGIWSRSPYNTALPLEVADLSPIQPALDKLPKADRDLVVDYLRRSNGDVLPAAFADPEAPFTARTFREAIALQKDFLIKQGERDVAADAMRQQRDAKMAPLRKVTSVRVMKREVLSGDAIYGLPAQPPSTAIKSARAEADGNKVLVVTYRLQNTSPRAMTSVKGTVAVRDAARDEVAHCFIDHGERIDPGSSVDVRCGQPNLQASAADIAFTAAPMGRYNIEWAPSELTYADGTRIASGL